VASVLLVDDQWDMRTLVTALEQLRPHFPPADATRAWRRERAMELGRR
jgi:hypothetical protein